MAVKKSDKSQATPETEQVKPQHNLTKVTVKKTRVKFFDVESNSVAEVTLIGKLTMGQCKAYVQMQNEKNVVVLKEPVVESFYVDTIALTQLREPEPVE